MSDPIHSDDDTEYSEYSDWRAEPSVQLLETLQGRTSGSDYEFDRLSRRISRTRDRLDQLEDMVSEVRSDLRGIKHEIPERRDAEIRDLEQRQAALEKVVEDHWDVIDEKAESLYDELSDVIASHFEAVDLHDDRVEGLTVQLGDVEADLSHESERRRMAVQELTTRLEQLEQNVSSLGTQSDELAQRHEVDHEKLANQFQETLDEIQSHLGDLYEKANAQEDRFETFVNVVDRRLEEALNRNVAEKELNKLLREAQRKGVTKATCQSCEEAIHLGLLDEPQCPYCERLLSGIETRKTMLKTRHTLTTHRPGHEFTSESIAESNEVALAESASVNDSEEADEDDVAIDGLDLLDESKE